MDLSDGIVSLLIKSDLLTVHKNGFVALTVRGREALKRAAQVSKTKREAFKKKPALTLKRTDTPRAATANRPAGTEGATATILRFRRR
jgi:hypothetical protein